MLVPTPPPAFYVNQRRVRPGHRALIVGMDPLAFTTAHALSMAGVHVSGLVNPPPGPLAGEAALPWKVLSRLASLAHLTPSSLLRAAGPPAETPAIAKAASALYAFPVVKARGAPVMLRHAAVGIRGDGAVSSVTVTRQRPDGTLVPGSERTVNADLICLASGLNPLTELAAAAGCESAFVAELGGHVPLHGPFGQTTVPGVYVAGNATSGVESALVAIQQGALTGQAIGRLLGGQGENEAQAATEEARVRVATARRQPRLSSCLESRRAGRK